MAEQLMEIYTLMDSHRLFPLGNKVVVGPDGQHVTEGPEKSMRKIQKMLNKAFELGVEMNKIEAE